MKTLALVCVCLSLMGCVFSSNNTKGPPDSSWMAECPEPARAGESLGSYYWWSLDLQEALKECNRLQAIERDYYLEE